MELSTPLKDKDKSPSNNSLPSIDSTPQPSQLSVSSTPFTEGKSRRTAATKADKYIDIVSRRLAEVPANGSTPKSMKIAGKLISEATPNSRRNILLSSTMSRVEPQKQASEVNSVPVVATPISARKRNRAAKIREMFQTPLLSLANAATSKGNEIGSLSPAAIDLAPSTISKNSKLSQVHTVAKSPIVKVSPAKSPVKRSQRASPAKSPLKRSQRVSPARKPSPLKEPISQFSVAATPKASRPPLVEFVAPQSVLRSSKRPRKQIDTSIYNEDINSPASPGVMKQAKFADPSIFPTVTVNLQSHVKIAPPQTPQFPLPSVSIIVPPNTTRVSNVPTNVPAIIVPLSAARTEEETSSSSEDLTALASTSSKRTPLRLQTMRTPSRAKAVIPSLSDYSAATKIAVIEVAKNNVNHVAANNVNNVNNTLTNSATPKVEPWTARFMQKDSSTTATVTNSINSTAPPVKSSFNINIKPVDTSKISGFSGSNGSAAVPIVPKFPLNLANISNITKSTTSSLLAETMAAKPTSNPAPPPPESPLTRAKRIDTENSSWDEKLKTLINASDKLLKPTFGKSSTSTPSTDVKVTEFTTSKVTVTEPAAIQHTILSTTTAASKLPVKPKSATTVQIPSRLAEAFSGIDSELPPLDIAGMVDDEKMLKTVLGGGGASSSGLTNPKMKKQTVVNTPVAVPSTPVTTATQLHRTAVLNSAARKINPPAKPNQQAALPTTPKPQITTSVPSKTPVSLESSSPNLPEIHSE